MMRLEVHDDLSVLPWTHLKSAPHTGLVTHVGVMPNVTTYGGAVVELSIATDDGHTVIAQVALNLVLQAVAQLAKTPAVRKETK